MQKTRKRAATRKQEESANEDALTEEQEATTAFGNAGWANSIAKVLNTSKPKAKKTLVLSRAKKAKAGGAVTEKAKPANYGFEVDGGDVAPPEEAKPEEQEDAKSKTRKNLVLALRVRPSWNDLERERTLRKVATRGVVQLFNAVRIEQKDLRQQLDEAGPLDSRKDAILNNINKRKFLDVLMSGQRSKSEAIDNPLKSEGPKKEEDDDSDDISDDDNRAATGGRKKSEWNVLRSDFMTNKKIKHWDEEEEEEQNSSDDDK